ncbi:MAG: hypothetical protein WDK96_00460 [Candidatus Paceibacterota bacterium]|jgi:hypothetical protein
MKYLLAFIMAIVIVIFFGCTGGSTKEKASSKSNYRCSFNGVKNPKDYDTKLGVGIYGTVADKFQNSVSTVLWIPQSIYDQLSDKAETDSVVFNGWCIWMDGYYFIYSVDQLSPTLDLSDTTKTKK